MRVAKAEGCHVVKTIKSNLGAGDVALRFTMGVPDSSEFAYAAGVHSMEAISLTEADALMETRKASLNQLAASDVATYLAQSGATDYDTGLTSAQIIEALRLTKAEWRQLSQSSELSHGGAGPTARWWRNGN